MQADIGGVGFFDGEVLGWGILMGSSAERSIAWRLGAFGGPDEWLWKTSSMASTAVS